ncbi:MAG: plastocyanin/azurin family copper-binding protein [Gemmatimonadota bacterium]
MRLTAVTIATLTGFLVACGGASDAPAGGADQADVEAAPTAEAPAPTGEIIEIQMITDEKGNYFEPANIEARRGDTLRFVLVSGVHNAAFPDSTNLGKPNMPGSGPMLQLPGQTWDFLVEFPPGEYNFQCDPHALLGMVGVLQVNDN